MAGRTAVRIGIAGLGRKGMHHLERLSLREDFEVAAVNDADPSRAAAAEHLCGRFVPVWEDLLADASFDVVLIATPPQTRAALVREALAARKHVAVESPLGFDHRESEELRSLSVCERRHVAILPAGRFDPDFPTVLSAVKSGALGRVLAAKRTLWGRRVTLSGTTRSGWPAEGADAWASTAGPPADIGGFPAPLVEPVTACLEQLLALIDEPACTVFATYPGSRSAGASFQSARAMAVRVGFSCGATAEIDVDVDSLVPLRTGWVIAGTDGGYKKLRRYQRTRELEIFDVPVETVDNEGDAIYDDLAKLLRGNRWDPTESIPRACRGWEVIRLLDAVRASAETGRAVAISNTR